MWPVLFSVGAVSVYSYPVLILMGILVGGYLLWKWELAPAREGSWPRLWLPHFLPVLLVALLAAVAGARIAFLLLHPEYFQAWTVTEILAVWTGGLVFHGGLIFGLAASCAYARTVGLPWLGLMDLVSPYFALAYGIGRVGCFLNGCCYGVPTDLPWGVIFPWDEVIRHPTQLYAAVAGVLVFFGLVSLRSQRHFPGELFWWFLLLHGAYRFVVEMVRVTEPLAWHLTAGQWVALALALLAGAALLKNYRKLGAGADDPG